MITDLLRNDLSRIGRNRSELISRYSFMQVPKLSHLFSEIAVALEGSNLRDVMNAVFPGGSITGAPKKRVMEIIEEVEVHARG